MEDKADHWSRPRVRLPHMHDDCVKTDGAKSGIENALVEGCGRLSLGAGNNDVAIEYADWRNPLLHEAVNLIGPLQQAAIGWEPQ